MTIKQAIDQVEIARPAAPCANRERAGELCFGARCKSGNLLMADMDPLDFP
jgi:hypothetical protein